MVKHEFEQPISITDICSGLDLQFSGYSRGPAAYNTNSDLIYLSGEERLTIIMDGFGPDTEGVNRKALNLIRNGLNRIKAGDVEKVRKEMGEVLFKSSNTLARRLKGVGGLSVVAVKYVSTPYLRTAVFGWLGKARLYSDDRGIYQPLTIDDIIFTVTNIQDPEWQSQLKSALGNVQMEKLDETTVRFILKEPLANFLNSLTFGILPKHKWLTVPAANATLAELNKKPVGTGPFMFASLTKDKNGNIRTYTLKRNDDYYGQKPYLKEISFKFYGDFESATDALANKNIQGLNLLPQEFQAKVEKNKSLRYYSLSLPQYTAIFFNTKRNDVLQAVQVRQALAYAINRQLILQESLDQKGAIINGPILPGFIGYHPDIKKYTYDPETAKKLLDEAGWKLVQDEGTSAMVRKKNDQILQLTLTTVEKIEYTNALNIIKKNWGDIGVSTNIEIIGKDRIKNDIIEPRSYDALLFGEIIKSDPYPFWHSSQMASPGANLAVWANRDVDQVLEEARTMENLEEINKKYIHFQNIISQYVPAIFLYNPIHTYPVDEMIKGITTTRITTPADRFNKITDWYIKTERQFSWKKPDSAS